MIDKLLVFSVCAVLLIALSLYLLLCGLPLLRRIEFDAVCHQSALLMDQSGGLGEMAADELVQALEERNFHCVSVQAPIQGTYGETMHLSVRAALTYFHLTPDLSMEEQEAWFTYEADILCRILKNPNGVP